jgi:hypothetical protein
MMVLSCDPLCGLTSFSGPGSVGDVESLRHRSGLLALTHGSNCVFVDYRPKCPDDESQPSEVYVDAEGAEPLPG